MPIGHGRIGRTVGWDSPVSRTKSGYPERAKESADLLIYPFDGGIDTHIKCKFSHKLRNIFTQAQKNEKGLGD